MLSRVADNLYWMSRYRERGEHTARLLDVNLNLMLDESPTSSEHRWLRVLHARGNPRDVAWNDDPYALTQTLSFDTSVHASIVRRIVAAVKTHAADRGPGVAGERTRCSPSRRPADGASPAEPADL